MLIFSKGNEWIVTVKFGISALNTSKDVRSLFSTHKHFAPLSSMEQISSYCKCLVCWQFFNEVQVSFLPVGHTHEDIDWSLSATTDSLRRNNAFILDDLHAKLRQTYNSHIQVSRMACVVNWSGFVAAENFLRPVKPFTKYRYFMFAKNFSTDIHSVQCTS